MMWLGAVVDAADGAEAASLLPGLAALAGVSFLAGAINSFAGGGTVLTFPVLAAILPPGPDRLVTANATSTIGIWPGALMASWAYRGQRVGQPAWTGWLVLPSVLGALFGAALVLMLPSAVFDAAVPWLILLAAVLFTVQPRIIRPVAAAGEATSGRLATAAAMQFLVSVYGGYFGAGIGILMLAVLAVLGLGDVHRLNAVKNVLGSTINGVAALFFACGSLAGWHDVAWPHAAVMAVASVAGSLAASHVATRLPASVVRRGVAVIGFALAGYYFCRQVWV